MTEKNFSAGALICAFLFISTLSIVAQGILTPPGAPAPTMKKLDEVEPRILIKALPFTIPVSGSGSYYLTASLTTAPSSDGITVNASNVTIDLDGFEVIGNGGAKSGIFLGGGVTNVTVRNGTIRNWGGYAINGVGNSGLRVMDVIARANTGSGAIFLDQKATVIHCTADGNASVGINVLANSLVQDCQVIGTTGSPGDGISVGPSVTGSAISGCVTNGNSGHGIAGRSYGTIENCTANSNTLGGILVQGGWTVIRCATNGNSAAGMEVQGASIISECTSAGNTNGGDGFIINSSSSITNCTAAGNAGAGITGDVQSTVRGCSVNSNHGDGIVLLSNSLIAENHCTVNGTAGTDAGIHVTGTVNRIDGNVLIGNVTRAIKVDGANNLIIRNIASGDGATLYDIAPVNEVGKIFQPSAGSTILGTTGGRLNAAGAEPDSFTNFAN